MDLEANLKKLDAVAVYQEGLTKMPQWKLPEHRGTDLWTRNRPWDTATHGKGGQRTMLYKKPLKDERSRRDDGRSRNSTTADRGLKQQLRLDCNGNFNEALRQTIVLEIRQAGSRVFRQDSKNERQDIVEEPVTAQAKEGTYPQLKSRRCRSPGHSRKCRLPQIRKGEWRDACRLLGTNSFKEVTM
jgi:hypothetical protein